MGPRRTVPGGEERVHADGTALCTRQVPLGPASRTCDPRRGSDHSPCVITPPAGLPKLQGARAGRGPPAVGKGKTPLQGDAQGREGSACAGVS